MQVLQFTPWTNYPIQIIKSAVPHDKIMACGLIPNTNSQQWIPFVHNISNQYTYQPHWILLSLLANMLSWAKKKKKKKKKIYTDCRKK